MFNPGIAKLNLTEWGISVFYDIKKYIISLDPPPPAPHPQSQTHRAAA